MSVLTAYDHAVIGHLIATGSTISETASIIGRNENTVAHYVAIANLLPSARKHHMWSQSENGFIRDGIDQGFSYYRIAQKLLYPTNLIRQHAYELGCTARALNYSICRAASMLGVSDKIVRAWITTGALTARNNGLRKMKHYIISEDAIYDFLDNENTWHLWDADRIVDGVLREHALEIREGMRWLTLKELAATLHYAPQSLHTYIYRGLIRVVIRGRGCAFAIREDWVEDAKQRMVAGGPPWWGDDPIDRPIWLMKEM